MKVAIWIGSLFLTALIMVLIENLGGLLLGPLIKTLLVVGACAGARALCKAYDNSKKE